MFPLGEQQFLVDERAQRPLHNLPDAFLAGDLGQVAFATQLGERRRGETLDP